MSVHKSTFWGPFFAMVAFSLLVLFIKGCNDAAVANAEWEAQVRSDSIRNAYYAERQAYDDSIKVIGDSIRKAEAVKDSITKVRNQASNRQRMIVEQCKYYGASAVWTMTTEEQVVKDCIAGISDRGKDIRAGRNLVKFM
jgi:hypothetical protein